jgi:isoquinoline 1-oxidoreductase beta subunit
MLVLESFMDELARKADRDPLEYRLALLDKNERARNVLMLAAKRSGWGTPLPPRTGRGIALMFAWGSYLAQVVQLSVSESGDVSVKNVVCVVDCGSIVNPDTVVAQMEGGINFGLAAALFSEITIKNGRTEQSNFHDYRVLRMSEAPKIEVEIVRSSEAPGGVGEAGTAGVGAAFVNAIYAATGRRLYALPAKPDLLKIAA